jgi:TRAP-type C4-dicarboxylate transport system substrate-binding protein
VRLCQKARVHKMKKKPFYFVLVLFVTALYLVTAASPAFGLKTLKFSNHLPTSHMVSKALAKTANQINGRTDGEIKIKILASTGFYEKNSSFNAVAIGDIDMAFCRLSSQCVRVPVFEIVGLPYAFPSLDAIFKKCRDGLDDFLDKEANKFGVKIITVGYAHYAHFFTKNRALLSPAAYKGLRFQANHGIIFDVIMTLGGTPVSMPAADVYSALEQGGLDGHVGSVSDVIGQKIYTFEKHGIISPLNIGPVHVIANLKTWDKLSSAQQRTINQSLDEMADGLRAMFRKAALEDGLRRLRQNGMKIHIQCAEEMDPFRYAIEPLYDRYREKTGKKGKQALNLILFNPFSSQKIP